MSRKVDWREVKNPYGGTTPARPLTDYIVVRGRGGMAFAVPLRDWEAAPKIEADG